MHQRGCYYVLASRYHLFSFARYGRRARLLERSAICTLRSRLKGVADYIYYLTLLMVFLVVASGSLLVNVVHYGTKELLAGVGSDLHTSM